MKIRKMFSLRFIIKSTSVFSKAIKFSGGYSERQFASRWSHRRPVRVLTHEEFESEGSSENNFAEGNVDQSEVKNSSNQIHWKYTAQDNDEPEKSTRRTKRPRQKTEKQTTFDMLQTVIDAEGNLIYTKMNNNDRRISVLLSTVKSKKHKEEKNLILLEGKRLIKEALDNNCKLQYLLFSHKEDLDFLKSSLPKSGANLYKMPYREMQMWSDLVTCPGVMGIFVKPSGNLEISENSLPITVICDNIREPGNLGSILRTCAGCGCQKVILTKGCVDVWDSKVTRSGSGAHFHLQIQNKVEWSEIENTLDENCKVYIAESRTFDSNDESVPWIPYYGTEFQRDSSINLIVGGETHGLSDEAYKCAHDFKGVRLNIPLVNGIDSLNSGVALGVIIFEIKKQMSTQNMEMKFEKIAE